MTARIALFSWLLLSSSASAQLTWDDDYRDAQSIDWMLGVGGLLVSLQIAAGLETPEPRWDGMGPLDRVADGMQLATPEARSRAGLASDITGLLALAPSFTFSPAFAYTQDSTIGGEVAAINVRSYGITALLVAISKHTFRRSRPGEGRSANRSFISGHTAFAFTGAALTCVNHRHLEIFGDPIDRLACASTTSFAIVTGLLRVLAGRHHLSDVLAGVIAGLFSGWIVPALATYDGFRN